VHYRGGRYIVVMWVKTAKRNKVHRYKVSVRQRHVKKPCLQAAPEDRSKVVRMFYTAQFRVHNSPRSGCPNENVFSDRLNREYDKSAFRKSEGKLFQALVAAAAKVPFPKKRDVRWTVSVLVSAERSLARESVTSRQSSAR